MKLKEIVDEEDAKEVMEFYNVMLVTFQKSVVISQSPRDLHIMNVYQYWNKSRILEESP